MNLRGKTVVITGASSGIGRATALAMAERGAHVVLAARRVDELERVADECRALGVHAHAVVTDVTRQEDCTRLIASAGVVDVLVNNAGFATFDSVADSSVDEWQEMMDTNFFGAVHATKAVLPQMLARGSGTIVTVASICGIMGYARMGGYCATKFALVGFMEALRDEVLPKGIRVSTVCPATTESAFFERAERKKMPAAERLLRPLKPERVARAVCNAAEDGGYRRILPGLAATYMRIKELFPRTAHAMMRVVSSALERGR